MNVELSANDFMIIIGQKEVKISILENDLNKANNFIKALIKELQDANIYDKDGNKIKSNIVNELKKNLEGNK